MALPGKLNLVTYQGDYFEREFLVEEFIEDEKVPVDFTGHFLLAQVRTHSSSSIISAIFDVDWVDQENGEFIISLPSNVTSRLAKNCVYDIQSRDPEGRIRTWVYGTFRVLRDVSRG